MPFPNLEGKHAGRPYVTARRLLDYHDSLGTARVAVPRAMMLTWQASPGTAECGNAASTGNCADAGIGSSDRCCG